MGNTVTVPARDPVLRGMTDALRQFAASRSQYLETAAPEALHQTRVGLRRIRTALAIMARHGRCEGIEPLLGESRRIAAITGPARQCDVLLAELANGLAARTGEVVAGPLLALLEEYRAHCHAETRAFLEGPGADAFLRNACEFAEALGQARLDDRPRKILDRLYRLALRRGRNFSSLDDAARHELRIALKKLRYGSEFFGERYSRKKRYARFLKSAARLQDLLGRHNDLVEAQDFLAVLPGGDAPELAAANAAVLALYANRDHQAARRLSSAWRKFNRARLFWH